VGPYETRFMSPLRCLEFRSDPWIFWGKKLCTPGLIVRFSRSVQHQLLAVNGICLERLRKTTKRLNRDTRAAYRYPNLNPPKHEAGVQPVRSPGLLKQITDTPQHSQFHVTQCFTQKKERRNIF